MSDNLLDAVRRYADRNSDRFGVAATEIAGLTLVRSVFPSDLQYSIQRPLACLIVQGSKYVTAGGQAFTFTAGDSLIVTADVPTKSQILKASATRPYYSLILDLDPSVIAELTLEMKGLPSGGQVGVAHQATDEETADAALRLVRLLDRPASLPVLASQLVREVHYWLLCGRHGEAIRRLGSPDGQMRRIARAVAMLRDNYTRNVPVEELAAVAGMSLSSFHEHFRAVTSLSPLQFQKQLRLIEARRLMLTGGRSSSSAASDVGYESAPQFTREYRRLFGQPPLRDTRQAQTRLHAAAAAAV